ncbi:SDR family NAD(P)-dependent oxidoreductase [Tsuneonella sp. HG094]
MTDQQSEFAGRSALVTGAASGIGLALCVWLADRGIARLVVVDRDEAGLAALDLPCAFERHVGDVAEPAFWDAIDFGQLDHAIINAGIAGGGAIGDLSFVDWRAMLSINLDGAFLSLKHALAAIRDGGSVVVTASVSGIKAEPGTAAYGASKAALIQLAKVAAKEVAPRRVRVNAIAPGGVDTPMWDQTPFFCDFVTEHRGDRSAALEAMAKMATPLGRYASAAEIAGQAGFLLSSAAATITGAVLVSDGGYSL